MKKRSSELPKIGEILLIQRVATNRDSMVIKVHIVKVSIPAAAVSNYDFWSCEKQGYVLNHMPKYANICEHYFDAEICI